MVYFVGHLYVLVLNSLGCEYVVFLRKKVTLSHNLGTIQSYTRAALALVCLS